MVSVAKITKNKNSLDYEYAAKMSLEQLRQLFYRMKDHAFGRHIMSTTSCTKKLTKILKKTFGNMKMDEVKFPR